MRVVFIHPNYHSGGAEIAGNWPPAWVAYLGGALKSAGFTDIQDIFDMFFNGGSPFGGGGGPSGPPRGADVEAVMLDLWRNPQADNCLDDDGGDRRRARRRAGCRALTDEPAAAQVGVSTSSQSACSKQNNQFSA